MKSVCHIRDINELNAAHEAGIKEVLLGHVQLSALGTLDTVAMHALATEASRFGIKAVVLWDTLMCDNDFDIACRTLAEINMSLFSAIRVLDPGALEFVLEKTELPIQLILRSGNHNIEAILGWSGYDKRIHRVVLSSELTKTRIETYMKTLSVEVEILGLVPILLFYSPRHLLAARNPDAGASDILTAMASCEESSHNGFRIFETRHGTLMFHSKDYSLLDKVQELNEMNVTSFQMDFRLQDPVSAVTLIKSSAEIFNHFSSTAYEQWAKTYPNRTTRCFYQANATDVLFKKLKNTTTQRVDTAFIGEVVESVKDRHTIIRVTGKSQKLALGRKIKIITPTEKTVVITVNEIRNLDGASIPESVSGDFSVLPHLRSVIPTSAVYSAEP